MHCVLFFGLFLTCAALVYADNGASADYVIDLTKQNFTEVLSRKQYKEGHVLIEFYAHWCPHCQHYKPTYEHIGRIFNQDPRQKPYLWVARVDCALKVNLALCTKFGIRAFPTIKLSTANSFIKEKVEDLTDIQARSANKVIADINKKLGTTYVIVAQQSVQEIKTEAGQRHETDTRFGVHDVERATVELFDRTVQVCKIVHSRDVRKALIELVDLLAAAHPSKRCRKGARFLRNKMDSFWPITADKHKPVLSHFRICTVDYEKPDWRLCAGSSPDKRGYTCGLWQLLHALTVGIEEKEVNLWLKGVRAFTTYFFGCDACAKHFSKELEKDEVKHIESREELIMWLWSTHNRVNKRLRQEESKSGTADPAFPKVQWPPRNLCPNCRTKYTTENAIDWNEAQVLDFLRQYYKSRSPTSETVIFSRTRLSNEMNSELTYEDVFSKDDLAKNEWRGSSTNSLAWLMLVVVLVLLAIRRTRRRKLIPRAKDIL